MSARLRTLLPELPHYFPRWRGDPLAAVGQAEQRSSVPPDYQVLATPLPGAGIQHGHGRDDPGGPPPGILVAYWTINDEAEMDRLLRLGADGIITDYPGRARKVLDCLPPGGSGARQGS